MPYDDVSSEVMTVLSVLTGSAVDVSNGEGSTMKSDYIVKL